MATTSKHVFLGLLLVGLFLFTSLPLTEGLGPIICVPAGSCSNPLVCNHLCIDKGFRQGGVCMGSTCCCSLMNKNL
ncbi:unnamed protein product [Amaranthus hypochondriacus]